MILRENNFDKIRQTIKKLKQEKKQVNLILSEDILLRKVLEHEKDIAITIELKNRKDKLYQRNSGFNEVLATLAHNNNITLGILIDEVISSKPIEKDRVLGRVRQNVELCKKKRVQMKWIVEKPEYERTKSELLALGLVLGMNTKMAKEAGSK